MIGGANVNATSTVPICITTFVGTKGRIAGLSPAEIKKEVQKSQINEKLNKIYKTRGKILL